ncbi:MAG TPA: triphosphoribosyl-dephospho-CoA synthase [Stellaceae bacterium]|nr:triphosphoribosyl-dephospho-CoA synthase [Stellaceae bacterium]
MPARARADRLQTAYLKACRLELRALKPGNVHIFAAGHGMTVAMFEASASASSGPIARLGATVGERILEAVSATAAAVGCNTNLGIVLLAAPLLAAAERAAPRPGLRPALDAVLADLTIDDAAQAFAAIRLAKPAGLGAVPAQDVAAAPTLDLRAAMRLAASRDLIARQYEDGFAEIFDIGLVLLPAAPREWDVTLTYLDFLSRFPDSHVMRKFGEDVAARLCEEAQNLSRRVRQIGEGAAAQALLADFDRALKERGVNPGTSADLTVASLLARACTSIVEGEGPT